MKSMHAAFIEEPDLTHFSLDALRDGGLDSTVDISPESCDHRVRVTSRADQRPQFLFS